jgi:uncharacterized protein YkwD
MVAAKGSRSSSARRTGEGDSPHITSAKTKARVKMLRERSTLRVATRLAALVMVGASVILAALAQTSASTVEQQLFASVNQARKAQGLPGLKWNEALATAARRHAGLMAQHGSAEHGYAGEPSLASRVTQAGAHFVWLAENVIQGISAEGIQAGFLKSANHRANMLDSDMDSIGVGVVERGGQLFAVEDFSKAK